MCANSMLLMPAFIWVLLNIVSSMLHAERGQIIAWHSMPKYSTNQKYLSRFLLQTFHTFYTDKNFRLQTTPSRFYCLLSTLMINVFLRYYYRDLLHILLTYVFYIFAKNIIVILYKIFCTLFTLTLSTLLQSILSSSITLFLHRCKECY